MVISDMYIRKGDFVKIISGDDAGKTGKIKSVLRQKGKIVVEGINFVLKHLKPSKENPKGGRIQIEASMDASNALLICQNKSCKKYNNGVRIRMKFLEDKKKVRTCVSCGYELISTE